MATRKLGRRKGSRNKGYFYRKGRGWSAKDGEKFIALKSETGEPLKDRNTPDSHIREAFDRWREARRKEPTPKFSARFSATVLEVCLAYLDKAKAEGAAKTYKDRADTLFDLCHGLPPEYRGKPVKDRAKATKIHPGYGSMQVAELLPLHIDQWLQAHATWNGGRRARIQAVKRALNYAVAAGMIPRNPIKGYKTPKVVGRVTYITPEQETAMYANSKPAAAMAIKVCIRTGARPGCEFAALTAKHVRDYGDKMEWVFQASESKTKRMRTIRIVDPEILAIVRQQIAAHPTGPIFRNTKGTPWNRQSLSLRFRMLKARLKAQGIELDKDACIYSCRHTYAKRTLQGYWAGKATNIETLAKLMGNSPQVCRDHYLQWDESHTDHLWAAC